MSEKEIRIDMIGGNCPVQAEGLIDGAPFYFRARGSRWSLSVGGADVIGAPEFYHEEPYGDGPYDAGWMEETEARAFIERGAERYRASLEGAPAGPLRISKNRSGKTMKHPSIAFAHLSASSSPRRRIALQKSGFWARLFGL